MARALYSRGVLLANFCLLISFHSHHCPALQPHLCLNLVIKWNAVAPQGPSLEAQDIIRPFPFSTRVLQHAFIQYRSVASRIRSRIEQSNCISSGI